MKPARPKFDSRISAKSIESLASAELLDWFVWDNLAMPAFERASGDRASAIDLLARAIARLSDEDSTDLPDRLKAGRPADCSGLTDSPRDDPSRAIRAGMAD